MNRIALLLFVLMPATATAQDASVTAENAPFAESGDLASRLDPEILFTGGIFSVVPLADMTQAMLDEARVIDINGDRLGDVDGVVTEADGTTITAVILPVGGVAGIGAKRVEVPITATLAGISEELGETRLVIAYTEDELQTLPAFGE